MAMWKFLTAGYLFNPNDKDIEALNRIAEAHPNLTSKADVLRYAIHITDKTEIVNQKLKEPTYEQSTPTH